MSPVGPLLIDLFCGAGGLSLGFRAAGCHVVAAVDADEIAGETYRRNFEILQPEHPPTVLSGEEGRLEGLSLSTLGAVDPDRTVLVGGPPCQGFSRVGRAKLNSLREGGFAQDPRNDLYRRFLFAVDLWHPAAVLIENVPGMLSVGERNIANEVAAELSTHGYKVGHSVLNAVFYGVPQYRERLFILGIRDDLRIEPRMPRTSHQAELPSGYIRPALPCTLTLPFIRHHELPVESSGNTPATTVADALDDLPAIRTHLDPDSSSQRGDFRQPVAHARPPHSSFAFLMRTWPGLASPPHVVDHAIRRTPRDYETFRRMKAGDRYPAALKIAWTRFEAHLAELAAAGAAPPEGSAQHKDLVTRFVPPYPEDQFLDKWRKLDPGLPAWTIPAHLSKDSYSHIHHDSSQARAISIREAARLQSFPDGYLFHGNMGDCFRQIGNAVPPVLAWSLASEILSLLGFEHRPGPWSYLEEQGGDWKGTT